jgi:hypothetical protein
MTRMYASVLVPSPPAAAFTSAAHLNFCAALMGLCNTVWRM